MIRDYYDPLEYEQDSHHEWEFVEQCRRRTDTELQRISRSGWCYLWDEREAADQELARRAVMEA